jgi:hypothetical protein
VAAATGGPSVAPAPQPAPAKARATAAPERAKPLVLDTRTTGQVALNGNGHAIASGRGAGAMAATPPAVVGALALAAPAAAIAVERREPAIEPAKVKTKDQPPAAAVPETAAKVAAKATARAVVSGQPRSWLHLGGPELSSLGKGALALSVIETCWGALVLALAIVEIAAQNSTSKPYLILAGAWFTLVLVLCLAGGQLLSRPVHRRGRISRRRRAFNGFGLVVYALSVHIIAIWGILVFSDGRPNTPLAIIAFLLFAVNAFVAGVLSLVNTLG